MQYAEFIERVQQQAELTSEEEALSITRATLETLGERIYRTARDDLSAQLPDQLKQLLRARAVPETSLDQVDHFPLEEFYQRVSARSDLGYPRSARAAKAVMATLREAVTPGEWEHLKAELPAEYDEILAG